MFDTIKRMFMAVNGVMDPDLSTVDSVLKTADRNVPISDRVKRVNAGR